MLALSGDSRFYRCLNSVDLRKGFEALSAVVESIFANKLLTNGYFIFFNKSRDKMKVLYWDVDGLAIWYKRLEKGKRQARGLRRSFVQLFYLI